MTETMKMDPELKERWTQALRSGEFEQGHSVLKFTRADKTTYCCLGVLSDICAIPSTTDAWTDETGFIFPGHGGGRVYTEMPPYEWLNDKGISNDTAKTLADMNDGNSAYLKDRQTFAQIADYIQENL